MDKPQKKIMTDMVARPAEISAPMPPVRNSAQAPLASNPVVRKSLQTPPSLAEPRATSPLQGEDFGRRVVSERKFEQPHRGRFLWVIAIAAVIALILGVGGLFAHATITAVPKTFSGTINTTINFSQAREPGSVFFATATKTFSDEIIVPATGAVDAESRAAGKVRFYNANSASKKIPAGTKLVSSQNIQYQTTKAVTVPGKKGALPGQTDVSVIASIAGSEANTNPDDFRLVTEKSFTNVTVKSFEPIAGGARGKDSIADPADIATATETLRGRFSDPQILTKRIAETIPADFIVLPISLVPSTPSIATETNHADGVHVVAKQTVGIIMVEKTEIARALGNQLKAENEILLTIQNFDGITMITGTAMSASSIPSQFSARVTGTANVFGNIETEKLPTQLTGKSKNDAKKILLENPTIQTFKIRMRPFWRRTLPINHYDIKVFE